MRQGRRLYYHGFRRDPSGGRVLSSVILTRRAVGAGHLRSRSLKIGVGVEGPSDRAFLSKVLHRSFQGFMFDIRSMNNKDKLIRRADDLVDDFRSRHYPFSVILVDRDSDACISATIDTFDQRVVTDARASLARRNLFICVAVVKLEAWYLADEEAIRFVMPGATYSAPPDTGVVGAERTLRRLWRESGRQGRPGGGKLGLARAVGQQFEPERARRHSSSFAYFWDRINGAIEAAS